MNMRLYLIATMGIALTTMMPACSKSGSGGGGPPPGAKTRVKAAPAMVEPIEERIPLVASITANESVTIKSEIDGTVERISFREGERVKAGDLLIRLDTRKLEAAVADAEANFNLAEATRERAESMFRERTISAQEHDQALSTHASRKATLQLVRQQLKDAEIKAPFEGYVGARLVSPGQVISKAMALTSLVDIDPVKVEFRVPERLIGQVRVGQPIYFKVAAYPKEEFRGEVYFVSPDVDPATRTVLVRALQQNEDGRLRPGMFGNMDLVIESRANAVLVPETALVHRGDSVFVFIVDEDGKAQMKPVVPGIRLAGRVEIRSGLQGDEMIIREGLQKLGPGAPVMIVPNEEDASAGNAS